MGTRQYAEICFAAWSFALLALLATRAHTQETSNQVSIEVRGEYRHITGNGIPDHVHGDFPNRNNPNRIGPQNYAYRVPLKPKAASKPTPLGLHPFGVAINGVPFDPGAAEFWNNDRQSGWQYEALSGEIDLGLDSSNAHVQPNGAYHYHGVPKGLVSENDDDEEIKLIGYAADGFPIYVQSGTDKLRSSYRVKSGTRKGGPGGTRDGTFVEDYEYVEGSGDLDECNGRTGVIPEYPDGTYH